MRFKAILAVALAAAAVIPMGSANAQHCDIPLYLFSNTRVQSGQDNPANGRPLNPGTPVIVSSFWGCNVIESDDPAIPGDESNTDIIYPGSNNIYVRYLLLNPLPVTATLTFAGETHDLDLERGYDPTGTTQDATFMDSQLIWIDPELSINGGEAVIELCYEDDPCISRTYRTLL